MYRQRSARGSLAHSLLCLSLSWCLALCAACGASGAVPPGVSPTPRPQAKQVLILPEVGVQDLNALDPALGADQHSALALSLLYSGLVRQDSNLKVLPDQATWTISLDRQTYTFHLQSGLTFSDGTPVTAQTYVYSLTRALLPAVQSSRAMFLLGNIVGAAAVHAGTATTLSGIQAQDDSTLVITLTQPTEYFLQALATPIAFPVNQSVVARYGEADWAEHVVGNAVGTGPFRVQQWERNTRMVLVPNPHYYGTPPRLTEVDIIFTADAHAAFQAYQGGQYSLVWNIPAADLNAAHPLTGYARQSLLETDALFFNTQIAPFDRPEVRQAFAYALDKHTLAQSVFSGSVVPAPTIVPPGLPGYQPDLNALSFSRVKALSTLKSVYPDLSQMPALTFSYPNSLVSPALALALRQMWQSALGISIKLLPVEINAYQREMTDHQIPFGFLQWSADFPDPYDVLALNLLSTSSGNSSNWASSAFDRLVQQAEQTSGEARLALYGQAEQLAITDVGWLPLDHQTMSAIIPPTVHGISLNHEGLFFGDWSGVYLTLR